uniref:Reverse transcriptase domain-containing protein n=1 Tax=Hordeum vulgare subsp. vulgare TaxID=112509 RepID=A0A8I6X987_HORVV
MPFGLSEAPATFQCVMNIIFAGCTRTFVLVFMVDILVFSQDLEAHTNHLQQVFTILREHQLYVKLSKCSFAQQQLEYLGHIISDKRVATDPTKTEAMAQWPMPTNVTELRCFLGLTGYYRKFVQHYGMIAKPLTNLLKKKAFQWATEAQTAFDLLKKAMTSMHELTLPDFSKPICIETDACDSGIGAVLTQEGHHVAYYNKSLGPAKQKLSIYEKEFLAIIMAVERWRSYMCRGPFVIKTDHQSLCHLETQALTSELQKNAITKLIGLQFQSQYKRGEDNKAADALSRVGHVFALPAGSVGQLVWLQEILNLYEVDCKAQHLLHKLVINPDEEPEFCLENGLLKHQGRIWVGANAGLHMKII